ncbi:hypothetical protein BJB45_17930 [Halomonas huangheensis]|uniref:Uncharacterized protein n=1 Tax=Halomonas huangheensis TaxID=1178482 RepID=W1ND13_9GAMM|nr:hypothetical protein BJB45_17930 [Halomonas huangheensis]
MEKQIEGTLIIRGRRVVSITWFLSPGFHHLVSITYAE